MWFFSQAKDGAGRVRGPLTRETMIERIRVGELHWIDLVIQAGGAEWKLAGEIEFLREQFALKTKSLPPVSAGRGEWIIHRKSGMIGPFTRDEVVDLIARGEVSYQGKVWHEGESAWQLIASLEVFDTRSPMERLLAMPSISPEASPSSVAKPAGEGNGTESDPFASQAITLGQMLRAGSRRSAMDAKPEEAEGEDMTGPPEWMKKISFLSLGLAFSLSLASSGARAATKLDIKPLKLETEAPQLLLETDATPAELIFVTVRGRSGDILKRASYAREVKVQRQPNEVASVELRPFRLPTGSYTVEAVVGELRREAQIFVGKRDESFERSLREHQKKIAWRQQSEKFALFYSSLKMESLVKDFYRAFQQNKGSETRWQSYFNTWKKAVQSAKENVASSTTAESEQQAHPEEIRQFQQAVTSFEKQADLIDEGAVDLSRIIASDEGAGSASLRSSVRDEMAFRGLRERAANLAGQP